MIFQSLDYLIFFVAVFTGYWLLPHRGQNLLLLAAGYYFYGCVHPWYLSLVLLTTVVDFTSARMIERFPQRKRLFLAATVITNFGVLGVFKYFGFFATNISAMLATTGWRVPDWALHIALPVGISFYTFQNVAYVADVYRGKISACKKPLDYALFGTFFPQLVAGPIERAGHLLAQVQNSRKFSFLQARSGLLLIVWGLFKKVAIADNVAVMADKAFGLHDTSFAVLWAGVFAFSVQIYADFSAYTDIARGSARLLGFDLMENFRHPWLATSPADFWRRWHISLSTWLRDYVYIPLGGSRGSKLMVARNLMITFLISGLWHGASWNFILWGFYWGALMVIERSFQRPEKLENATQPGPFAGLHHVSAVLVTFALTSLGWLFFREQNIQRIFHDLTLSPFAVPASHWRIGAFFVMLTLIYSLPLVLHAVWDLRIKTLMESRQNESTWAWTFIQSAVGLVLFAGILTLASDVGSDFIYFKF
ncbi:MAG TPA: MBOAT family O-acyltransferase [Chthoniobacterales bacterium]